MSDTTPILRLSQAAGVLAPLAYAATVVAGGASIAGYNHFSDPISSLTESGRTGVTWIVAGFLLYNLLTAGFALGGIASARSGAWRGIFALLLITALCGLLMWPFTQDPIGSPPTLTGTIHMGLAGIESLSSLGILATAAWRSWRDRQIGMAVLSGACFAVTFVFGGAAALAVGNHWAAMGLFERLTIGSFELWILLAALRLVREKPRA